MRLAITGLVTIAAALMADVQAASAINYDSFFQERYCSRRANARYNCAFKTLDLRAMQIRNRGNPRPILHREPLVGRASTAEDASQESSAQSLEAGLH